MDPEDTLVDIIEEVYDRAILKTGRNTFNMAKFLLGGKGQKPKRANAGVGTKQGRR